MSAPDASNKPGEEPEARVSLKELVFAVRSNPGKPPNSLASLQSEFALVDAAEMVVGDSYKTEGQARGRLFAEINRDSTEAALMRIVRIDFDGTPVEVFPRDRDPLQRARAFARSLNVPGSGPPFAVNLGAAQNYLLPTTGALAIDGTSRQIIALRWPDPTGHIETIGYLHETPTDGWQLLLDAPEPPRPPEETLTTLAGLLNELLYPSDQVINEQRLATVRRTMHTGDAPEPLADGLAAFALYVAEALGVLDPSGDDL